MKRRLFSDISRVQTHLALMELWTHIVGVAIGIVPMESRTPMETNDSPAPLLLPRRLFSCREERCFPGKGYSVWLLMRVKRKFNPSLCPPKGAFSITLLHLR